MHASEISHHCHRNLWKFHTALCTWHDMTSTLAICFLRHCWCMHYWSNQPAQFPFCWNRNTRYQTISLLSFFWGKQHQKSECQFVFLFFLFLIFQIFVLFTFLVKATSEIKMPTLIFLSGNSSQNANFVFPFQGKAIELLLCASDFQVWMCRYFVCLAPCSNHAQYIWYYSP